MQTPSKLNRLFSFLVFISLCCAGSSRADKDKEGPKALVQIKGSDLEPNTLTIPIGYTVVWFDPKGKHVITADDGSFKSAPIPAGETYDRKFDKAGSYHYHCKVNGAKGQKPLAGTVTVRPSVP